MTKEELIAEMNRRCDNGMMKTLGVVFEAVSETQIVASFCVTESLLTPTNLMHGGVSLAVAEGVAGAGSFLHCDAGTFPVGSQVSGNHIKSATLGMRLVATGTLIHCGKKTHLWNVDICNEKNELVATARVTNHIISAFK